MRQVPQAPGAAALTADVQTVLNEHPFSRFQWAIFALCFVIVLLDGFDTAAIGYIAPSLLTEWGLSKPDLAPVLSAALFGLAGGAVCSGPLATALAARRCWWGRCWCLPWAAWHRAMRTTCRP